MKILSRLCILGSAGTSISWRAHGVNAQSYGAGDGMDLPTGPMEDASLLQSRFRKRSRSKAREAREARKHPFHLDRHDHHHAKIVDTADYRADAAAFFEKVKNQSLEERCPHLHKMTLNQVHKEWKRMFSQLEKTTGNMTAKNKLVANYDLHFEFNSVLAGEMPVLVTGHVPKQLGWEAATHWGRDELSKHLGTLPWQKFTFNYPEWLIGMDQWESLDDYIKHNESSQNIFLFASEGGCSEEAKLKNSVDAIRR
ncbi:FCA1, partial [Symbiodinium microadriaticum]